MKRHLFYLMTALALWGFAARQSAAQLILPSSNSVYDFRQIGELRYWTFVVRDSVIGSFTSVVEEPQDLNGETAITLRQKLKLDYSKVGMDRKVLIEGQFFVGPNGGYMGDSKTISFGERQESLELSREGDTVSGYFTRGGKPVDQSVTIKSNAFGYDANFIDELEIALASTRLEVGQPIECNLFEPQSLLSSQLNGFVEDFRYEAIYQGKYDSVFAINLFTPENMYVLMTKDKRVVKVDLPDQRTKIYLDLVKRQPRPVTKKPPSFGLIQLIRLVPNYLAYLVVSVLAVLLFIGRAYRWKATYLAYFLAAAAFWIMVFTQFPIQEWLFKSVFMPSVRQGGSIYIASILPVIPVGVMQTLLGFGLLILLQKITWCKDYQLIGIGAALGAGFGFMEACYLDSIAFRTGFDFGFVERAAILAYHGAAVAFIGYLWGSARRVIWSGLGLLVVINALLRYLPVLVQTKAMSIGATAMVIALVAFVSQGIALIVVKQKLFRSVSDRNTVGGNPPAATPSN